MAYTPPDIQDAPSTATPLSSANIKAWLSGVASYADTVVSGGGGIIQVPDPTGNATTDRAAIQSALTAAGDGDIVRLASGSTYTVNSQGTKAFKTTSGSTTQGFCLEIPSNTTLDLNGSTIRYGTGAGDVILLCNQATNATTDVNVNVIGYGTLDGAGNALTNCVCAWFEGVTGMILDVRFYDTKRYGLYMSACSKIKAPRIHSDLCAGQPLALGNPGNGTPGSARYVSNSHFGSIISNNVTAGALPFNEPGNPVYMVAKECTVDTIQVFNGTAGLKIDRPTVDLQIGKVHAKTNTTNNSGLKIQGNDTEPGYPLRVTVGEVHCIDQGGAGLWMDKCVDCTVGLYTGESNADLVQATDIWIGGIRDRVVQCRSTNSNAGGLIVRDYAVDYKLGIVDVYNANRSNTASTNGVTIGANSKGTFGQVTIIDSGVPGLRHDRGLRQTASSSVFTIERLKIRGWITSAYTLQGGVTSAQQVVTGTDTSLRVGIASETVPGSTTGDVIYPLHGLLFPETAQVGVINRFYCVRARVPATGSIRGISYFVGVQSGNCIIAVYDTGQAANNNYTRLGDSGSLAVAAANTWQTWDPGAGVITVSQGQDVMLCVMFDNTTASFGRSHNFLNVAASQLPTGSFAHTPQVLPKLTAIRSAAGFAAEAAISEGNMSLNNMSAVFIGRVG